MTPLLVFGRREPQGWQAAAPQSPAWWLGALAPVVLQPPVARAGRAGQISIFELHPAAAADLADEVRASPIYASQRERARRTPLDDGLVRAMLQALIAGGGRQPQEVLASVAQRPTARSCGSDEFAGGSLARKSVHNVHVCLHGALEAARADGSIRTNPVDGVHRNPRKNRPEMKTWTIEEVRAFLAHVAGRRDFALYRLALNTGMRRGELLGLRWRDLDLDAGRLHVRQQWSRQDGKLVFGPPKTERGRRTIDLDEGTVSALRQHGLQQEFERRSWGHAYRVALDLVICRADGSPEDPDVVGHRFDRIVIRASLPTIRFHDQRHTHATLLLEDGVDAKYVSERLGHDSVQTTLELYGHVTPKRRADAVARISALVDGPMTVRDQA